jgi:hypothetical protein
MIPINKVPVGKFVKWSESTVYIYKNNFKDTYGVFPIEGIIPINKKFNCKVYVYKKYKKEWVIKAIEWLNKLFDDASKGQSYSGGRVIGIPESVDNLLYIENLAILKNYLKPVIVKIED